MHEWRPENHFIVHALIFLKRIFYVKTFETFTSVANGYALSLLDKDRESYLQKVEECIQYSHEHLYDISQYENCPLVFKREIPEHEQLLKEMLAKAEKEATYIDSPLRDAYDHENITGKSENNADNNHSVQTPDDDNEDI